MNKYLLFPAFTFITLNFMGIWMDVRVSGLEDIILRASGFLFFILYLIFEYLDKKGREPA